MNPKKNDIEIFQIMMKTFLKKNSINIACSYLFLMKENVFSQMRKMKQNGLFSIIDVIICDAGSKDGTTRHEYCNKIRVLLTRKVEKRHDSWIMLDYME